MGLMAILILMYNGQMTSQIVPTDVCASLAKEWENLGGAYNRRSAYCIGAKK